MTVLLSDLLRDRLTSAPDRTLITVRTRSGVALPLTGTDLLQAAADWNARWKAVFGSGPFTFILALPPGNLFLKAVLAGLIGGHTLVPVAQPRPGVQTDRLAHIAADCEATAILCAVNNLDAVVRHMTPDGVDGPMCPIVAIDASDEMPMIGDPARRAGSSPGPVPAIIQYTSGSTCMPKGVRIMDAQILANCARVGEAWDLGEADTVVSWLPHYHDMGLFGGIVFPLLRGAVSVQINPLDMIRSPLFWLQTISEYRGSFSGGPAFAYAECLKRIDDEASEQLDLSSWRAAFCGAEPISAELLPSFRARFGRCGLRPGAVFACYGLAEYTLFAAGMPEPEVTLAVPPADAEAVQSCRLGDGMREDLRIVDPETRIEVADGQQGEIWLRGASKGGGYVNLPQETKAVFDNSLASGGNADWLRTGDLGIIDDAHLYVTGRIKDVLIANGRKVSAAEFEWLAGQQHDALNPLAAAAFMPNPNESAMAVLLIEVKSGHAAPDDLAAVCGAIERAALGAWGIQIRDLHIVPRGSLDRTSSGKIRRQHIAEAWRRGAYPASGARPGAHA